MAVEQVWLRAAGSTAGPAGRCFPSGGAVVLPLQLPHLSISKKQGSPPLNHADSRQAGSITRECHREANAEVMENSGWPVERGRRHPAESTGAQGPRGGGGGLGYSRNRRTRHLLAVARPLESRDQEDEVSFPFPDFFPWQLSACLSIFPCICVCVCVCVCGSMRQHAVAWQVAQGASCTRRDRQPCARESKRTLSASWRCRLCLDRCSLWLCLLWSRFRFLDLETRHTEHSVRQGTWNGGQCGCRPPGQRTKHRWLAFIGKLGLCQSYSFFGDRRSFSLFFSAFFFLLFRSSLLLPPVRGSPSTGACASGPAAVCGPSPSSLLSSSSLLDAKYPARHCR